MRRVKPRLPHEVFASLAAKAPDVMERLFGSADVLQDFWRGLVPPAKRRRCGPVEAESAGRAPVEAGAVEADSARRAPVEAGANAPVAAGADPEGTCARDGFHREWCASHPVIRGTPPELRVPLGIHGDGAGSTAGEKVFVMTWGGLATPKPATLDSRLVFTCLRESEMALSLPFRPRGSDSARASGPAPHMGGCDPQQHAPLRCPRSRCNGCSRCSPGASRRHDA